MNEDTHKINQNKMCFTGRSHLFQQAINGLSFLHSKKIVHCDVKFANILVSPDGKAKISDLGSVRKMQDHEDDTPTVFLVTKQWAHPTLMKATTTSHPSDSNRMRAEVKRSDLKYAFDMYAFGKNLLHILKNENNYIKNLPRYHKTFLELMAARMLDGANANNEVGLSGLPISIFENIKYTEMTEIAHDLKKITGEYALHEQIPELDHHFPQMIQISKPNCCSFTDRVSRSVSGNP